jgi:hypothetical protein
MSKQYTAIIDIDTLLIHAALAGQRTSIKATGKNTGRSVTFSNRTELYGTWKKKDGGWLAEVNVKRKEKGLDSISPDVFDIEDIITLIPDQITDDGIVITPEIVVKGRLKNKIEAITSQPWCKDFKICFGTGKNFRYDLAETTPYKSERALKPVLYEVVRDYMIWKYKDHLITHEGVETDEIVTQQVWEAWVRSGRNFDKLDAVSCHIDKDLDQIPCLKYNFDKPELGLVRIEPLEALKNLATQILMGDKIDTVPGLPKLPEWMYKEYSLRKTASIGETTARGILVSAESAKDVFERVITAYKGHYGEEMKEFTSFRGEVGKRNYLDHLNEQFRLLRMRTDVTKDVGHVKDFVKTMGIEL